MAYDKSLPAQFLHLNAVALSELLVALRQARLVLGCRAGNGSMGHGSMGQMGHFFRWVTWVMGHVMVTHEP